MPEIVAGLVSAIVPVFNRPAMLREAVASILNQTYRPIEIIISDDGSTDDTGRTADDLAAAHPDVVRIVHGGRSRGAGPAREAGRQLARGEFIQYLDSDDLLLPAKYDLQVRALRRHPECGAAYGCIRLLEKNGTAYPGPYKGSGEARPFLFPRLLVERWWNTDCPLYRRSVCDAAGPWLDLPGSQDWIQDARVGGLKTRLVHVPDYVCVQREHKGQRQTGHGKWLAPRDRVRFFSLLLEAARQAGVEKGAPEMERFSRWVFLNARECGAMGDGDSARTLHAMACEVALSPGRELRLIGRLADGVGWKITGLACQARDRIRSAFRPKSGPVAALPDGKE